jgi:hypothetical protein
MAGVWEDEDEVDVEVEVEEIKSQDQSSLETRYSDHIRKSNSLVQGSIVDFELHNAVVFDGDDDFEDENYENDLDKQEAARLLSLVKLSFPEPTTSSQSATAKTSEDEMESPLVGPTTTIMDDESVRKAKKRRKKLLKNMKAINNLKIMISKGKELNEDQMEKVGRENEWLLELESVEHNLQ